MDLPILAYYWPNYDNVAFILGLVFSALFLVASTVFYFLTIKRKTSTIVYIVFGALYLLSLCMGWDPFTLVALLATIGIGVFISITNNNEICMALGNFFKAKGNIFKKSQKQPEALFDRDAMYSKVNEAVLWFSRTKTGALITFEKRDPLDSFITTGVPVNAPVSAEILETIFYEGTRLHDGAVIIRNNEIVSAACLYQPSTKAVTGKMGLRHRAAMGISQDTDSVTVVVSEETGRISIAYDGELQAVNSGDFLRIFEEYMSLSKNDQEEN